LAKVHVDMTDDLHQRLRIKAAYLNLDYQSYVADLVERDTADVVIPDKYRLGKK
jgi:predicted DNA binding CopG/RHH family protein